MGEHWQTAKRKLGWTTFQRMKYQLIYQQMETNRKPAFFLTGDHLYTADKENLRDTRVDTIIARLASPEVNISKIFTERLSENKLQIDLTVGKELDLLRTRVKQLKDELQLRSNQIQFLQENSVNQRGRHECQTKQLWERIKRIERENAASIKGLHQHYRKEKGQLIELHQQSILYGEVEAIKQQERIQELERTLAKLRESLESANLAVRDHELRNKELREQIAHQRQLQHQHLLNAQKEVKSKEVDLDNQQKLFSQQMESLRAERVRDKQQFQRQLEGYKEKHRTDLDSLALKYQQASKDSQRSYMKTITELSDKNTLISRKLLEAESVIKEQDLDLNRVRKQLQAANSLCSIKGNQKRAYENQCMQLKQTLTALKQHGYQLQDALKSNLQKFRLVEVENEQVKLLLKESCLQLDNCRDQLLFGEKERASLRGLLEESETERERTNLLIRQREAQMLRWRENYYTLKSRL